MSLRRCVAVVLVLVAVAAGVEAPAVGAAEPAVPGAPLAAGEDAGRQGPAVAADDSTAARTARSSRTPVEVMSRRTDRVRTIANPDGSWTSEVSAVPVRVRRTDGSWVPVDTTLRRTGEHVVPVAVPMEVRFSAGGAGPAARLAIGAREVALSVPWVLPEPVLDGPRATYREVLPGVDLVLTAQAEGFSQVLVVHDRAAAAHPALRQLRFGLSGTGMTLRPNGGGFVAVDAAGRTVFSSPAPRMWDSAGDHAGAAASRVAGSAARQVDWPAAGDRQARMAASIAGDRLSVVPDRALLEDPATVFPVYVDPSVTASRSAWAMIQSGFGGDDEFYKFTGDEGVGLCDVNLVSSCNADNVKRLVWMFAVPTVVRGSHVLGATFKAYETHAYDCTADRVDLYRTGGVGPGTNWDNHASTWTRYLSSATVARKTGCPLGPGWVEFNATGGAQEAVAAGWQFLALGLKAYNEGSMPGGWKRFRYDATLSITYNSYPSTPTSLSAEGRGCATGSSRPVLSTATPTLRATVSDPNPETDLRAVFAWESWTGSAWSALGSGSQSALSSGATGQFRIGSGLVNNGIYRWRAQTQDPWSFNGSSGTDSSAWSGYCEFVVDLVGPTVAPGVSSLVYGTDLNQVYGAVGLTATFTFTASGITDVTGYRWGWADPPTTYVAAPTLGGSVTLPLTPPPPKPNDPTSGGQMALYVVSVDRAGRTSPLVPYVFNIGSATDPIGVWQMNEPAGSTTLADSTTRGTPHPATLTTGTAGAAGRILSGPARSGPTAVTFNGSTSYAATASAVLDTSKSFTISAWARPTVTKWGSVISQSGTVENSPFDVQYSDNGTWSFDHYSADGTGRVTTRARSTTATPLGVWVHVLGVYDAGAKQIRLYLNGTLAASATVNSWWRSTGPLQIGRVHWAAGQTNYFAGDVAEVKAWDRVVSAPELAPMAATLVGRWGLDGDPSDATGYGRDLTAPNGVSWNDDHEGLPLSSASLNGVDQALHTAGPALRTDQPYTVAGWVRWNGGDGARTALAQDGLSVSHFFLGCRTDATNGSRWTLMARGSDSTSSTSMWLFGGACELETWTHLASVYDPVTGQYRLFVDGVLKATGTLTTRWHAGGGFTIGRGKWAAPVDFWTGDIDDVQVYAGALPASEIAKLAG